MADYGQKISDDKYLSSSMILAVLFSATPKESAFDYHKKQLFLDIDYKLGQDFPEDRREQLHKSIEKHKKYRFFLMAVGYFSDIVGFNWLTNKVVNLLVKSLRNAHLKVLSEEDTNAILGGPEETLPTEGVK